MSDRVPLSLATRSAIRAVFDEEARDKVEQLLLVDCGPPGMMAPPETLERIRLAALKIAAGNVPRLHDAVLQARIDWRDVLMGAGFGSDLSAHRRWHAEITGAP